MGNSLIGGCWNEAKDETDGGKGEELQVPSPPSFHFDAVLFIAIGYHVTAACP